VVVLRTDGGAGDEPRDDRETGDRETGDRETGDRAAGALPTVLLYRGLSRLVDRSGAVLAIRHQEQMLDSLGYRQVRSLRECLRARPDVVHLNTVFPDSWLVAAGARRRGIGVVYYGHSTEDDFRDSWVGANLVSGLFRRWITASYRRGDVVVTPTPYAKRILDGYGLGRPVHAVSNGVDTRFFAPDPSARDAFRRRHGLPADARVVVTVGHLMERKGVVDYAELARRLPDVHFWWYGHTPRQMMTDPVRAVVDDPPANLHLGGYVDRDELRQAYCGADAFVFCSHEETEGIVVLEALAAGVPVLLRDIGVYEDWLPDGEVVHKARDVDGFDLNLRALLAGELPDLTRAARALVGRYDVRAVARTLERVYRAEGLLPTPDPGNTRG